MRTSSLEAKKSFDRSGQKENHYKEILKTLNRNGKLTCRGISENNDKLSYFQVQKRMKEMEDKGLVKVVGRCIELKNRPLVWKAI